MLGNHLGPHPETQDIRYHLSGPPLILKACMDMLNALGVDPENSLIDDFG